MGVCEDLLDYDDTTFKGKMKSEVTNYTLFLVYQTLDFRDWAQIHWHFLRKTNLLRKIVDCLGHGSSGGKPPSLSVKTEATLVFTCFVQNCREAQLVQWLILQLDLLPILAQNLSETLDVTTNELTSVSLDLIHYILGTPNLNKITPNVAYINLPTPSRSTSGARDLQLHEESTMKLKFEVSGGLEALEQLQFDKSN